MNQTHDYINHQPPPFDAYAIDAGVAERVPCPECGGQCRYDSHYEETRNGGYHYRAFAICKECGNREEF